jgi:Cu+-exporting ATPase
MVLHIQGMACPRCSGRVEKALNAIEGVTATVDLKTGTATVSGAAAESVLRSAVEALGFTVTAVEG